MKNSEKKNQKVLCIIEGLGPGGAERQIIGLARALKDSGHDVSLMYFTPEHFYKTLALDARIETQYVECTKCRILRAPILCKEIIRYQPDVVISYLRTASFFACIARCLSRNFRLIVSERNTTLKNTIKDRLYFLLFRRADYIVTNSFSQKEFIKTAYPKLKDKTVAIPNFVDMDHFRYNMKEEVDVKDISKTIRLICVGRIDKQKNIPLFLSAVRLVVDKGVDIHVDWYGQKQNDTKRTMKTLRELNLEDTVFFRAPIVNIDEKYREADALCLPSLFEGTPNAIIEAMCCGIPVICSDVCDNSRLVQNGVSGILFNPTDVGDIVEAIMLFSTMSEEERLSMGIAGHRFVSSAFSRSEFVNSYQKLLSRL